MGMVNQQGNMPRELKESWLFKSDKSQSSENSGTTHQEEQEQQQERVDQVGYELKSKGVVTVVEAGGKKKMEEEQQEAVQQDDVDLEKGLEKGHGAQEERS